MFPRLGLSSGEEPQHLHLSLGGSAGVAGGYNRSSRACRRMREEIIALPSRIGSSSHHSLKLST